jgi:hypothetical protein
MMSFSAYVPAKPCDTPMVAVQRIGPRARSPGTGMGDRLAQPLRQLHGALAIAV